MLVVPRFAASGFAVVALALPMAIGVPLPVSSAPPLLPLAACAQPTGVYALAVPWPQRLLDPERIWPLTTGVGVTVAVLGTGVDAAQPQFASGQVRPGMVVRGAGRATADCDGRGTFAAGLVAAQSTGESTFAGMAPGARILPVKFTETTDRGPAGADPDALADAIDAATDAGAGVIYVAVPTTVDSDRLRAAVARAIAADAVVVASVAAGGSSASDATAFPASDPAVLSVGAVDPGGKTITSGGDVSAPGAGLVSLAAGSSGTAGHVWPVDDPVYSAAFVAATAALVRAYRPDLTGAQVVARIERTAAGGMVDPYAAVTAEGIDGVVATASAVGIVAPAPPDSPAARDIRAAATAFGVLLAAAGAVVVALVLRRARSRGWRASRRA